MRHQRVLIIALSVVVVSIVVLVGKSFPSFSSPPVPTPMAQATIRIGNTILSIEVADTPAKITKGLGYRDELGSEGMLFVMPTRSIPSFWMKGMRFPLDFVWIDSNTVVDLTEHVSHQPGAQDQDLSTYSPSVPVTHVLEIPAGDIAKREIKIGDAVKYEISATAP